MLAIKPIAFVSVLSLLAPAMLGGQVRAAEGVDRQAMADAMSRMMEAMGFGRSGAPFSGSPWSGGGVDGARRSGQETMNGFASGLVPGSASALEGLWEAAGGGLLIVQGGRYRLYAPSGAFVDGSLALSGARLKMWNRRTGFASELDYALDQGRLALRDSSGQIYLYRSLVLPGGD